MRNVSKGLAGGLLLAMLWLAACGGNGTGEGVVLEVDPASSRITIDHGEIPGMMKAMTMTFAVAEPSLLEGIEAGDRVDFRLRYADGVYTVIELEAH
jgi:Cu/Ag efflux protein CusF